MKQKIWILLSMAMVMASSCTMCKKEANKG